MQARCPRCPSDAVFERGFARIRRELDVSVDFPAVMRRMREIRARIAPHDSAERYQNELGVDVFLGEGPIPQDLADTMHAGWTRFVRDADPRTESMQEWPTYLPGRHVMEFGDRVGLLDDPDHATRRAWEGRI